ncbi:MAG: glutamate racemase [Bacillota bacterium]
MEKNAPLGLFDSGVGGLTVVREVFRQLPREKVLYFADTGRVPYGPLPQETIQGYTVQIVKFLQDRGAKLVIIACNTATAAGLDAAREAVEIPVIGVIEPGAELALETTDNKRIGVIGTEATIKSGAYDKTIKEMAPDAEVFGQPCYEFTPLIEAGKKDSEEIAEYAREYLATFDGKGIDTLVYGCTHYPLLEDLIQGIVGEGVAPVNPAIRAVEKAEENLVNSGLLADRDTDPEHEFFVTGDPKAFARLGEVILQRPLPDVNKVELD